MFLKISVSLVFLLILFAAANGQKKIDPVKGGILNGRATYLPKPDYPPEAKDFCAGGKVEIRVLIGEKGNVIEAEAVSGDELLHKVSVEAVKKATFNPTHGVPVKVEGKIVYNFDSLAPKCISLGIVNKKAEFIPKPEFPKSCRCTGNVVIQVIIDLNGKVMNARAISGHPLLRVPAVKSARGAIFQPTLINGAPFYIKAFLVYDFSPNGKVTF